MDAPDVASFFFCHSIYLELFFFCPFSARTLMILFKISLGLETKMQMPLQKHEQLKHESNKIKESNREILEAGLPKEEEEKEAAAAADEDNAEFESLLLGMQAGRTTAGGEVIIIHINISRDMGWLWRAYLSFKGPRQSKKTKYCFAVIVFSVSLPSLRRGQRDF